jgi:hypothetical protein
MKASLTQIHEAQDLEDELVQECEANQALLACINELTCQLDAEPQEKCSVSSQTIFMPEWTLSQLFLLQISSNN